MAEFHKKESEELEKEHDKLYELLEEDKKKVCLYHHLNGWSIIYFTVVHRYLGLGWKSETQLVTFLSIGNWPKQLLEQDPPLG